MTKVLRAVAVIVFIIVVLAIVAANKLPSLGPAKQELYLEMMIKSSVPGRLAVIHKFVVSRLTPECITEFQVPKSDQFVPYRLRLSELRIWPIFLNPVFENGEWEFKDLRIVDGKGKLVREISPATVESMSPSATIRVDQQEFAVTQQGGGQGAALLYLNIDYPIVTIPAQHPVTKGGIVLMLTGLVLVCMLGLLVIVNSLKQQVPEVMDEGAKDLRYKAVIWICAALAICVGARWWLIDLFGLSIAHWDSWDLSGWSLFVQFFGNNLTWRDLFDSVNEHRTFFTRLLAMGVLLVNGEWDARLEMLVNSALYSFVGLGLCLLLWQLFGRRNVAFLSALIVMAWAAPLAWENTLWATQSQFYFMVGLSIPTIWLLALSAPYSARWWSGLSLAVACIFTVSSGSIAVLAVLVLMALKVVTNKKNWRVSLPTMVACAFVFLFAMHFAVREPAHAGWRARSVMDFVLTTCKGGAWPWTDLPWLMPILWLPVLALLVWYFVAGKEDKGLRLAEMLLGLSIWVGAQITAIGLFRGSLGQGPESRYLDIMSIGMVINGAAGLFLLSRIRALRIPPRLWAGFVVFWWVIVFVGVLSLSMRMLEWRIPNWRDYNEKGAVVVNNFLSDNNAQKLFNSPDVPFVNWFMPAYLRNPVLRSVLPASMGQPIKIIQAETAYSPMMENCFDRRIVTDARKRSWGSFMPPNAKRPPTVFVSRPIVPPNAPYLEFDVAGDVWEKWVYVYLQDEVTKTITPVRSSRAANMHWQAATVPTPKNMFTVVAVDERNWASWIAFREPTPKARLSAWADFLLAKGAFVFYFGLALIVVLVIGQKAFGVAINPRVIFSPAGSDVAGTATCGQKKRKSNS